MSCALWKREFISVLLFWITYMTSHFWLVVSRECTNIVIITLYYFCMYAQFFFQSAFVDFDYGLQPLHYLHDFLHECILKYTRMIWYILESSPILWPNFSIIVSRVVSIFWYTYILYKLLLFFFSKRSKKSAESWLEKMN